MTTTGKIIITGVQEGRGPQNATPRRLEINTLLANSNLKNLYLLGLERMQSRKETDMKSWYQVAGIHGRPFTPWNGEADSSGGKPGGYCTHSSILFLTWHRPYLALYEQVLYEDIKTVVESFPEPKRSQLAKVAMTFRIPYWDWAAQPKVPSIFLDKSVEVEKPNGTVKIPNPLYSYRFTGAQRIPFPQGRYRNWTQTIRHPLNSNSTESQDSVLKDLQLNDWKVDDNFNGQSGPEINLRERIWHLLNIEQNRYPTYPAFSNNRWVKNGISSDYDSLESVHDSLHYILGGNGHLGNPGYAGFDPLFWLHHCNVDRLYAIWQGLHYEADQKWDFGPREETEHLFHWWVPGGDVLEQENTPLIPFRKSATEFWNSNTVRDLKAFGYTYPELVEWNVPGVTREKLSLIVSAHIKNLYGTTASAELSLGLFAVQPNMAAMTTLQNIQIPMIAKNEGDSFKTTDSTIPISETATKKTVKADAPSNATPPKDPKFPNDHREYFANIRAPKYDFGGPFAVHVFIGDFSVEPKQRIRDPNLVGTWNVFASDVTNTGCKNCKQGADMNLMVTGSIPLTGALIKRLGKDIESLEIEHVVPYLKKNLHWRIHKADIDHTNVDRGSVSGQVNFTVTSAIAGYPSPDAPTMVYRDWNPLPEITEGRPTGAGWDDAEGYEPGV